MAQVVRQSFLLGTCWVEVIEPPAGAHKTLILLPGWNYSRRAWCEKSSVCEEALRRGYRLLLLEMGKSIYASRVFPETRADWRQYPTLITLRDTVLPALEQKSLLPPNQTYLLGLSTGGRGVVLLLAQLGRYFRAGAALSGDFDPHLDPRDPLLTGWYGRYSQRWDQVDNPLRLAASLEKPLFLAHGVQDKVVPYEHTLRLHERLQQLRPSLRLELHIDPQGGHDFAFWDKYGRKALDFFESL